MGRSSCPFPEQSRARSREVGVGEERTWQGLCGLAWL